MPTENWRTTLPCTPQTLWDWHARPGAFRRLAPPWEDITFLEGDMGLDVGARTVFTIRKGPARIRWEALHTACQAPHRFVDTQEAGPFAKWVHDHRFLPAGDTPSEGTILEDEVTWKPPGGPFGAVAIPALKATNARMFRYRHTRTARDLARHAPYAERPRLRVAITGATGLVGTALQAFLTTGGHEVVRVVRRDPKPGDCVWDVRAGTIDLDALQGVDAVVHLAGAPVSETWTEDHKRAIRESRIQGTSLIADAVTRLDPKPKVLISASAIGIYGVRGDEVVTEHSDLGNDFLAEVGKAWEAAARPAAEAGIRVVHPRIGIVTTSAGAALAKLLPVFRAGGGGPVGSGEQWISWITLDDLIASLHCALFEPWEGVYNAVCPYPLRQLEQARALGKALSRPAVVPAPAAAVRAMFGEMGETLILGGQRVVPERLEAWGFRWDDLDYEAAVRTNLGLPTSGGPDPSRH